MTYLTQKQFPRRAFLRGVGATMALPFLDAMVPAGRSRADMALHRGRDGRSRLRYREGRRRRDVSVPDGMELVHPELLRPDVGGEPDDDRPSPAPPASHEDDHAVTLGPSSGEYFRRSTLSRR